MRFEFGFLSLVLLLAAPVAAQEAAPWCFSGFHPGEVAGTVGLPEGDLAPAAGFPAPWTAACPRALDGV